MVIMMVVVAFEQTNDVGVGDVAIAVAKGLVSLKKMKKIYTLYRAQATAVDTSCSSSSALSIIRWHGLWCRKYLKRKKNIPKAQDTSNDVSWAFYLLPSALCRRCRVVVIGVMCDVVVSVEFVVIAVVVVTM
jgi:hypothetical protein